jgi:hypothetical protein
VTLFIDWQKILNYRKHVCPVYLYLPTNLHGFTLQKEAVFIAIAMRSSIRIYISRINDTVHIDRLTSLYKGCFSERVREKSVMTFDAGCM